MNDEKNCIDTIDKIKIKEGFKIDVKSKLFFFIGKYIINI